MPLDHQVPNLCQQIAYGIFAVSDLLVFRKRPVGCIWRQSVGLCINGGHEPNLPPLRMSLHHGC